MYKKIKRYIESWRMFGPGDKVIAGISGGADSICLLFVLLELRDELGIEITAVHVNHGLRGESANRDEAYVRAVCEREGVKLRVFHRDVGRYAKEHKLTVEEAGRNVRRECFRQTLSECGGSCIALAHHQNDNAETVLWNLCRGSALKGMGGIPPKNGIWIHPLLSINRAEIESYLEKRGIPYCTDETNLEEHYTRNRIRNKVIPYLEQHINEKAVGHIARCAETLRKMGEYIEAETAKYMDQCIRTGEKGEIMLSKAAFEAVPDALKSEVMYGAVCRAAGERKDIGLTHVQAACELLERQTGRRLTLPYGVEVLRDYEGLLFRGRDMPAWQKTAENATFWTKIFENESKTFPEKIYTKWFDYDIIKNTVKIRHREPGDYIVIDKSGRTQKLKQYFINEKIPRELRDSIWLAADGKEIIWIVGYRQSQAYQITEDTKRILEIGFYGGEKDVRNSKSDDSGRGSDEKNC